MHFFFVTLMCLFTVAKAATTCTAVNTPDAGCTVPACTAVNTPYAGCTATTTKAARTNRHQKVTFKDVHLIKDQTACLSKNGKWIEITLTDEGGTNGLQLDLVSVDSQKAVKTLKTPTSSGRRLGRRDDVVTFKDSFCMDYYGIDYAPCYDIVTSSQGKNLEELSWSIKVSALKKATKEEIAKGGKDRIVEAIKEGTAYDDVKMLCGRLYKQMGRFAQRQIQKLKETLASKSDQVYRHHKTGDAMLRTVAKIAQKSEDLGLISSN